MLYFGCIIFGIIVGIIFEYLREKNKKIYGVIEVDDKKNICRFLVDSKNVSDPNNNKAIFRIVHNIDIRDNNTDYNE